MVIILGLAQVSKRIPFSDPNVLNTARAAYVISNLIVFGMYMMVRRKINSKKGETLFM